jgi:hypothetical protein
VTRVAFILGANGSNAVGKLKYARDDAARIAEVLSRIRYSFEIVSPTRPSDPYEIKRELDKVAKSCEEEDAFLFFFSGHGELFAGELMLVLDESVPGNENTYLPVEWIKEARRRCTAASRLIILDCCHAEAASGGGSKGTVDLADLGIETKTDLMLLASPRLERAREFEHLRGSFLTTEMCRFLMGARTQTVNLSDLMTHLHSAAIDHNRNAGAETPSVPIPFLNGSQQGEFLFTRASRLDLSSHVTIRAGQYSVSIGAAMAMDASAAAQGLQLHFSDNNIREMAKKVHGREDTEGEYIEPVIYVLEHRGVQTGQATAAAEGVEASGKYYAKCFRLNGLNEVALHLELGRPVLANIRVNRTDGWYDPAQSGVITETPMDLHHTMFHVIVLVSRDASGFTFANSWGAGWGNKGFGKISNSAARALIDSDGLWAIEVRRTWISGQGGVSVSEIAQLYSFPTEQNGDGQIIGLLEFGGGYDLEDINAYFLAAGLPVPDLVAVSVDGVENRPEVASGDKAQVSMDIELVGAIAPKAQIRVYFAPFTAVGWSNALYQAVKDHVSVVSIGWGLTEDEWSSRSIKTVNRALKVAAENSITVIAAAGDRGATDGNIDKLKCVSFPASSPWVIAVGGTSLEVISDKIVSETAWNDSSRSGGATGGGVSAIFGRPAWQLGVQVPPRRDGKPGRGIPDVSATAATTLIKIRVDGRDLAVGGTGVSAPLWAGLIALINQGLGYNVGYLNPRLYREIGPENVLRAVTEGNNRVYGEGYDAAPGWNPVAGWGTPRGIKLLNWLQKRS